MSEKHRVLIVEDGPDYRSLLTRALTNVGYEPFSAAHGQEALRAFWSVRPDLVLLDLRLPGMSGLDVCTRIREMSDTPIIVFSAVEDTEDKLAAFERGADDYLVKAQGALDELIARVRSGLRRLARGNGTASIASETYDDGTIAIDYARCAVAVRGGHVELTPIEYQLLCALVERAGQPIPADQLLRQVWGQEYTTEDLVKWHIRHLRRKIERSPENPSLVTTRRGYGYVYVRPASEAPELRALERMAAA